VSLIFIPLFYTCKRGKGNARQLSQGSRNAGFLLLPPEPARHFEKWAMRSLHFSHGRARSAKGHAIGAFPVRKRVFALRFFADWPNALKSQAGRKILAGSRRQTFGMARKTPPFRRFPCMGRDDGEKECR
jgi:hypothetical protein